MTHYLQILLHHISDELPALFYVGMCVVYCTMRLILLYTYYNNETDDGYYLNIMHVHDRYWSWSVTKITLLWKKIMCASRILLFSLLHGSNINFFFFFLFLCFVWEVSVYCVRCLFVRSEVTLCRTIMVYVWYRLMDMSVPCQCWLIH